MPPKSYEQLELERKIRLYFDLLEWASKNWIEIVGFYLDSHSELFEA